MLRRPRGYLNWRVFFADALLTRRVQWRGKQGGFSVFARVAPVGSIIVVRKRRIPLSLRGAGACGEKSHRRSACFSGVFAPS